MSSLMRFFVATLLALSTLDHAVADPVVRFDWHVLNRFPLFKDREAFEAIEREWSSSRGAADFIDQPGITKKLRDLLPIRATAWNPMTGTYEKNVLFRKQHEIRARLIGAEENTNCAWRINDDREKIAPCAESPPLKVSSGQSFKIIAKTPDGVEIHQEVSPIKERLIIAIGDSFSSGEGNPDHPAILKASTPNVRWQVENRPARFVAKGAEWWDEACHRSLLSWPALSALDTSIKEKTEVIQFASFACSGAEVYDGILRAQVDPPGNHANYLIKASSKTERDGGPGYRNAINSRTSNLYQSGQIHRKRLRLSQQHALAKLLCSDELISKLDNNGPTPQAGTTIQQWYFGKYQVRTCKTPKTVDQLLISIGGNDVGFSGIVRWLITPPTAKNDINKFFLDIARKEAGVIEPKQARVGISQLPAIYTALSSSLATLKIQSNRIVLLQYPNPADSAGSMEKIDRCNLRTREGNAPMQAMIYSKIGNSDFLFGINKNEYRSLDREFVEPLRKVQLESSRLHGWALIDSQLSFSRDGIESRGYCGVATTCSTKECPSGDKVRWWNKSPYSTDPHLASLAEFDAYDPSRTRGLRYGIDALLAGVAPSGKNGRIRDDWLFGTAHPTANIHARIADQVNAYRQAVAPQR